MTYLHITNKRLVSKENLPKESNFGDTENMLTFFMIQTITTQKYQKKRWTLKWSEHMKTCFKFWIQHLSSIIWIYASLSIKGKHLGGQKHDKVRSLLHIVPTSLTFFPASRWIQAAPVRTVICYCKQQQLVGLVFSYYQCLCCGSSE